MDGLRPGAPALFDQLAQLVEYFIAVQQLAGIGLRRSAFELCFELLKGLIPFHLLTFEKAKGLSHHFAGGLVAARLNAALKERVEFRCDRDVDCGSVGHLR